MQFRGQSSTSVSLLRPWEAKGCLGINTDGMFSTQQLFNDNQVD